MTEGETADSEHDDAPLVVPPGVPLSVWEWLLPPVFVTVLAVVIAWFLPVPSQRPYAIATAAVLVVVAFVQCVFGFRAFTRWDDSDIRWHKRSESATVAALGLFALPFLFGMASVWLFATSAYLIAADPGPAIGRVRSALSARAWIRLTVVAAIVAFISVVGHALASAFGFGVVAWILTVAGAIAFGFALRAQPPGNEPLPARERRDR